MGITLNKHHVIGKIGKDPKIFGNEKKVGKLSVATEEMFNGQVVINWIDCTAFGKLVPVIQDNLHKGSFVDIIGLVKTSQKDGKYYTTTVIQHISSPDIPREWPKESEAPDGDYKEMADPGDDDVPF
jgi:single-stranded DNA-binding protein